MNRLRLHVDQLERLTELVRAEDAAAVGEFLIEGGLDGCELGLELAGALAELTLLHALERDYPQARRLREALDAGHVTYDQVREAASEHGRACDSWMVRDQYDTDRRHEYQCPACGAELVAERHSALPAFWRWWFVEPGPEAT